jgi:hypothetical protein
MAEPVNVSVWLARDGFFGPCLHAWEDCTDGGGERIELAIPEAAFPLPTEWCCSKCGDSLWFADDVEDDELDAP